MREQAIHRNDLTPGRTEHEHLKWRGRVSRDISPSSVMSQAFSAPDRNIFPIAAQSYIVAHLLKVLVAMGSNLTIVSGA